MQENTPEGHAGKKTHTTKAKGADVVYTGKDNQGSGHSRVRQVKTVNDNTRQQRYIVTKVKQEMRNSD